MVSVVVSPADSNQAPVATFTATPPTGTAPLSVFFDATGSSDPDGIIVSYAWDFGDGSTGTGDTTSYIFTTAGTYDVRLIVTDDSSATDTFMVSVVVSEGQGNLAPVAQFIANPTSGNAPLLVSIDASASIDVDGTIISYMWDYGDGNTGNGVTTSHTYLLAGEYSIQLIVIDNQGARDTASTIITVLPPPGTDQIADMRMVDSLDCENNILMTTLQIRSANIQTFRLGTSSILFTYNDSALQFAGYESLSFDGSDRCIGGVASAWDVHAFDGSSVAGIFNLTLVLESEEFGCPEVNGTDWISIGKVSFNVLDGSLDPRMAYDTNNTNFNVDDPNDGTVVVENGSFFGLNGPILDCSGNLPPEAFFTADPLAGAPPLLVSFDANASIDPDGSIVSYEWAFGDGGTGTGVAISHTYMNEGSYEATLIVTDDQGAKDTMTVGLIVSNGNLPPIARFEADTLSGNAPFDVAFDASESTDIDGTIESYRWDFGDGIFGDGLAPSHIYQSEGTYLVTLIVIDDGGASDTTSITITVGPPIVNQAPVASFVADPLTGNAPLEVNFDAALSNDPDGEIISYIWNFGDGNTNTGVNATHTYAEAGVYTVRLIVTDNEGATDTAEVSITVIEVGSGPVADLRFVPVQDCESDSLSATIQIRARTLASFNLGTSSIMVTYDPEVLGYTGYTPLNFDGSDACIEGVASSWDIPSFDGTSVPGFFNLTMVLKAEGFGCPTVDSLAWVDVGTLKFAINNPSQDPNLIFDRENTNFNIHDPNDGTITVGKGDFAKAEITPCSSNQRPEAIIVANPDSGLVPLEVSFVGSNSQDIDGDIVSYIWDFGDGTRDTAANVIHTYTEVGEYIVTLIVMDNEGAVDTAGVLIQVVEPLNDPIAGLQMMGELDCERQTYSVTLQIQAETATSFNLGDSRLKVVYNSMATNLIGYTSANFNENTVCGEDSRNPWSAHQVNSQEALGEIEIGLLLAEPLSSCPPVTDDQWISIGTLEFQIQDTSMLAYFMFDSLFTQFNLSSPNDGSVQAGKGTFAGLDSVDISCQVKEVFPPIAVITTDTTQGFIPLTINFSGENSTDPDSNIVSYLWDFGVGDSSFASGEDVTFTFETPGNYTVTLIVVDADSLSDTAQVVIFVGDGDNFAPVILCNVSPDSGITPINVLFDATQSFDPDGDELTFFWEFGDGTTGDGPLVSHTYTTHGEILVTLTVSDGRGGVSTHEKTLTLFPPQFGNPGDTLSVETFSLQWDVFPNPLEDFAVVRLRDLGDEVSELDIEIHDHAGRRVLRETVTKVENILDYRLDLGHLGTGIYILSIRTTNSLSSRHIIVK